METSIVGIHFVVTDQHFENGKLKLRCSAQLHDIYWKTTEKTILEADPFGKYGGNGASGNRVSADEIYDQYTLHEDEQFHNKKNSYLTQLQGEEDDGADGLEDGGAAWRGVSSASSSSTLSLAPSGLAATLLALLSWSLARQLVSQLAPITKHSPMPMPMRALQPDRQSQSKGLRALCCTDSSNRSSGSSSSNNKGCSKGCSRCIRQLT
ncbi:uncharacterized protein LOC115564908 [Drosophila navojoa]|nr:uncharacterized protein LOC115564908 [Drosophila navojoa]